MGKMGNGYGSEYQLLRMMGRHRRKFDKMILEMLPEEGTIEWFDFETSDCKDREVMNVDFLCDASITSEWRNVWPTNGGKAGPSWDAVGRINNAYILLEAKAHKGEMKNSLAATDNNSINRIKAAFSRYQKEQNLNSDSCDWTKIVYQKANRIIVSNFLTEKNIEVYLVYVYFINGYKRRDPRNRQIIEDKSFKDKNECLQCIEKEKRLMHLDNTHSGIRVYDVFIDCEF